MTESRPWDGTTPVYSRTLDRYFMNIGEIADDYNDDVDETEEVNTPPDDYLKSLELCHAVPCQPPKLNIELIADYLPDYPSEIEAEVNKIIAEANAKIVELVKRYGIIEDSGVLAIYEGGNDD